VKTELHESPTPKPQEPSETKSEAASQTPKTDAKDKPLTEPLNEPQKVKATNNFEKDELDCSIGEDVVPVQAVEKSQNLRNNQGKANQKSKGATKK
jgi:hypothetical protein